LYFYDFSTVFYAFSKFTARNSNKVCTSVPRINTKPPRLSFLLTRSPSSDPPLRSKQKLDVDRPTPATVSPRGENRGAGKHPGPYAHLRELGIGGRRLGAAARRRPAAGGEVARWGSVPVPLDDGGEVGELPGGVLELRPGSA
jgi:hypothetical protein